MFENDNKMKSFRNSKNLEAVMVILEKANMPMTVDNIHDELKKKNENISLSTVYRIMEKLTLNNIVSKSIIMDTSKARYELIKEDHKHYLICVKCNRMIPLEDCPLEDLEKNVSKSTGFNITGHKLELYGVCSSCSK